MKIKFIFPETYIVPVISILNMFSLNFILPQNRKVRRRTWNTWRKGQPTQFHVFSTKGVKAVKESKICLEQPFMHFYRSWFWAWWLQCSLAARRTSCAESGAWWRPSKLWTAWTSNSAHCWWEVGSHPSTTWK